MSLPSPWEWIQQRPRNILKCQRSYMKERNIKVPKLATILKLHMSFSTTSCETENCINYLKCVTNFNQPCWRKDRTTFIISSQKNILQYRCHFKMYSEGTQPQNVGKTYCRFVSDSQLKKYFMLFSGFCDVCGIRKLFFKICNLS